MPRCVLNAEAVSGEGLVRGSGFRLGFIALNSAGAPRLYA